MRNFAICLSVVAICLPVCGGAQPKAPDLQSEVLKQAHWRSIGPAIMGGRVSDIAAEEANPFVYYVGLATGGVMKTTNGGTTWSAIFENQPVASIGAIAIAPSDSKTVYVGTGEPNGRNSSAWGNGVYKSTDSGATWQHIGLEKTQSIGRIVVDPQDPKTVWVAAVGHLWGANEERGVYKSTDGGKNWAHSLKIDKDTGIVDLALTPDGKTAYAAAYYRRRLPYGYLGISDKSGIYRTVDSGKSWQRLTKGLPTTQVGRIGVAISRSQPKTVYAVIESQAGGTSGMFAESKYGGVFRSDDGGESWKQQSKKAPRGFYFGQIRVDPKNPEAVYVLGFDMAQSSDGGKIWKEASTNVHSDLHALWIDPNRPDTLVLGTDGGVYVSHDRGGNWRAVNNFAAGEFYEVAVDNARPFRVLGGLQDNGSWRGPSTTLFDTGAMNSDWEFLFGGDGFYTLPHPTDPDVVYGEAQGGSVGRINRRTGLGKGFRAEAVEGAPAFRFNWNTPLETTHFDPDTLYIGGNRLFAWKKGGTEWEVLSPDLSRMEGATIATAGTGAETYATIVALSASPVRSGTIWCGTDDGNVQVTTDGGKHWVNTTNNLPERVRKHYVKRIKASAHDANRAYVAYDGHRTDDMGSYLFVTDDGGKTYRSIIANLPKDAPVRAIAESPLNPEVLFVGTEFGAFVSFNRGEKWEPLKNGLPTVAVDDLKIHPRDHALVAATHGRSIYILDNVLPLETLTPDIRKKAVHLFSIAPGLEFIAQGRRWFGGSAEFIAENPPQGVEIVYFLRELQEAPAKITITDKDNKTIAELTGERLPGLSRLRWNMRPNGEAGKDGADRRFVKAGEYTATLTVGKEKLSEKFQVAGDPLLATESSYDFGGLEKNKE